MLKELNYNDGKRNLETFVLVFVDITGGRERKDVLFVIRIPIKIVKYF